MLKKILSGILFIGLTAVLVIGAINRTKAKSEDGSHTTGRGQNETHAESGIRTNQRDADNQGEGAGAQKRGGGSRAAESSGQYVNYEEAIDETLTYAGIITQVPAAGVDLIVETDDGELIVGTGPLSLVELGLAVGAGDAIEVKGYWEEDEFKAVEILQVATGQTSILRDGWGRPVWSGSAQNGRGTGGASPAVAGQPLSRNNDGGRGEESAPVTAGVRQAQVDAWMTLSGKVTAGTESALVVRLHTGEVITFEGRPWRFAQEQGFAASLGDEITMLGFYEGDQFEAGQLTNVDTDLTVAIRQENGRPLWAGGGRQS